MEYAIDMNDAIKLSLLFENICDLENLDLFCLTKETIYMKDIQ